MATPSKRRATNEQVPFRLIACPECNHQMCWVNPRLPSHCPECGKHIYLKLRAGEGVLIIATAWLRIEGE
jgi:ribosomal protein S27E